jgi:hypothetical protein
MPDADGSVCYPSSLYILFPCSARQRKLLELGETGMEKSYDPTTHSYF